MSIRNEMLHLTRSLGDTAERDIDMTQPGMAHFANTGPFGATCGDCKYLGYRRSLPPKVENGREIARSAHTGGCLKFRQLTSKHGPPVPPATAACRHFEAIKA